MYFGVCLESSYFVLLCKTKCTHDLVATLENEISKLKENDTK